MKLEEIRCSADFNQELFSEDLCIAGDNSVYHICRDGPSLSVCRSPSCLNRLQGAKIEITETTIDTLFILPNMQPAYSDRGAGRFLSDAVIAELLEKVS